MKRFSLERLPAVPAVLIALLVLGGEAASSAGGTSEYRSRFRIGIGLARGLDPDSAETHLSVGLAAMWNIRPRIGIGVEGALHDLFDKPDRGSFGLARLTATAELRFVSSGPVFPFAAMGAGIYSWRSCRGSGSGFDFCSLAKPDRERSSLGAWVGAGVHAGLAGRRSLSAALQIHPLATFDGAVPFAHAFLAAGF
ncbi:MAG: hypothetical protein ABIH26_10175 [Candidatus Eisenbacteria bacterium]